MSKLLPLVSCLLVLSAISASAADGTRTSLEDVESDISNKLSFITSSSKVSNPAASPTKFGFVPQRTAAAYAATKPKYQYSQAMYRVKQKMRQQPIATQQYSNQQIDYDVAEQPQYYYVQLVPNYVSNPVAKYSTEKAQAPGASEQYYRAKGDEMLMKREPKSLLESYVPSAVQLRYLRQQKKY